MGNVGSLQLAYTRFGKAKRLFHQEEQGIGEQQQHSVNDEISVHASVDFCQVVFCNQLESKVDGKGISFGAAPPLSAVSKAH